MRDAFFSELLLLFKVHKEIVFLTGDLGYKLFDQLCDFDRERVINVGIREAGMAGFAAGLAKEGMLPFIYSIVPFVTLRCLEQIKIDICYNKCKVIIVGVGGGFSYGPNGPTHYGVDDVGVMSCLSNLTIWTPCDPSQVRSCVRASIELDGPAYLRLGRNGEQEIHDLDPIQPPIDAPEVIKDSDEGFIVTYGVITREVIKAVDRLKKMNHNPGIIHICTLRPFPSSFFEMLLKRGLPILAVEEHISVGGLGQEVSKIIAERGMINSFRSLSIPNRYPGECLSYDAALAWAGLDADNIVREYDNLFA